MKKMNLFLLQTLIVTGLFFAVACSGDDDNNEEQTPPPIGQPYKGGIVAYIDGTGKHGLIAAPADQSTGIQWYNGSLSATSATLTAIGTGKSNTAQIVQVQGNSGSYAAKLCKDLNLNGYKDWFLPSRDEFMELYENRALIGGFSEDWYWTSSEENGNTACAQHIGFGNRGDMSKDSPYRVRAVRYF